jgi:hypothetical protein
MKNLIKYICWTSMILCSCKKECEDGIEFYGECIETVGKNMYTSEYKTDVCNVSLLFEFTYGEQINAKEYQYSHSHDPNVHWTIASNVKVGQKLNGGVMCRKPKEQLDEVTQFYFMVPEESSLTFPVTILRINKNTYETLDSTVVMFRKN